MTTASSATKDAADAHRVKVFTAIRDIPERAWDACGDGKDPFTRHAFLDALESSGSVTAETGWLPQHLAVLDETDHIVAVSPFYLKSHSYGEYVFDWAWADAYERAGGRYYPKFQSAIPFTPVTGRRLCVGGDRDGALADVLAAAMVKIGERAKVSSVHVTFPTEADVGRLENAGFIARMGMQYHWHNDGYERFDDFLATLAARKRKAIKKERAAVIDSGVAIRTLIGSDIGERHWDAFHRFYLDTVDRKWAHAYLNRRFFDLLRRRLADRVVLIAAEDARGRMLGAALNLLGGDTLYGRYWGGDSAFKFLHFELCYYRAIDFAIERGLRRVEAGAQGQHKVQRGYLPRATWSAHWIADSGFRAAISRFLASERATIDQQMAALMAQSPFRQDGPRSPA